MANSQSDALVVFGATGDLAHKMIFPALYAMVKRGVLNVPVIGVAFPKWSLERLHRRATDSIKRAGGIDDKRTRVGDRFGGGNFHTQVDLFGQRQVGAQRLGGKLEGLDLGGFERNRRRQPPDHRCRQL